VKVEIREAWWGRLQLVTEEELTGQERDRLSEMLQSSVMAKAMGIVLHEVWASGASLLGADLSSQAAVNEAVRLQGQAAGITRAIEKLGDMATEYREGNQDG